MLCRTANELYWMARHIERAENTARLLDVTYRMSLLPYEPQRAGPRVGRAVGGAAHHHRRSPRRTTSDYPELSAENVLRFMILDASNPSSIYCCLRAARESARSGARRDHVGNVRGPELGAWLEMRGYDYAAPAGERRLRVPRLGEDALASLPRRDVRHACCATRPITSSAWARTSSAPTTPRASSTSSTTSCCRRPPTSAAPSTITSGRAAALGVGLRGLPQDLQRRHHAAPRGRAPDPARRHAALAAQLHELDHERWRSCATSSSARDRARRRASSTRGCTTAAPTTSSRFGLHEYLMDFLDAISCWATRSAGTSSSHATERRASRRSQAHPRGDCVVSSEFRLAAPMTYCVAMSLDAGMIFASDSRTNAGVDQIARFSKMRVIRARGRARDRHAVLGQPVDHAERAQHARAARARRRQPAQPVERRVDVRRRAPARRLAARGRRRATART